MLIEIKTLECCENNKNHIYGYDGEGKDNKGKFYKVICFECGNKLKYYGEIKWMLI